MAKKNARLPKFSVRPPAPKKAAKKKTVPKAKAKGGVPKGIPPAAWFMEKPGPSVGRPVGRPTQFIP